MRDITMKELLHYETIKYVCNNPKANRRRACYKLGVSDRHLRRLIKIYKTKGKAGFIHGNVAHVPHNKIDSSVRKTIVEK
jgi:hypothetical protein